MYKPRDILKQKDLNRFWEITGYSERNTMTGLDIFVMRMLDIISAIIRHTVPGS